MNYTTPTYWGVAWWAFSFIVAYASGLGPFGAFIVASIVGSALWCIVLYVENQ